MMVLRSLINLMIASFFCVRRLLLPKALLIGFLGYPNTIIYWYIRFYIGSCYLIVVGYVIVGLNSFVCKIWDKIQELRKQAAGQPYLPHRDIPKWMLEPMIEEIKLNAEEKTALAISENNFEIDENVIIGPECNNISR